MKNIKASSNAMLQFITPELISKFKLRYLSIFNGNTFALFHPNVLISRVLNLLNYKFACGPKTSRECNVCRLCGHLLLLNII